MDWPDIAEEIEDVGRSEFSAKLSQSLDLATATLPFAHFPFRNPRSG
jgi:hypothetical protein